MNLALEEAEKAFKKGEVPVGCIIVDENDNIVSKTHNLKEAIKDTTAHAEILAIKEASQANDDWRLIGHTAYITLEPCPMCMYALLQARVDKVVFGAYDSKAGSVSLGYNFHLDKRFNHSFDLIGGVEHFKCSKILSNFFKQRRKGYKVASKP
jgi:tRNA(adenine34) deaminase